MTQDAKTTYAQSSDIKSRTYLQYRYDMKKKAIAELEVLDWLDRKMKKENPGRSVEVAKSGGDKFLWFLRKGGVSREPDYVATIDGKEIEIEFQYGKKLDLPFFDFKVSKVARKNRKTGEREPIHDRMFLLIEWSKPSYAIIEPKWIFENGEYGMVPAWRSYAFRVPANRFDNVFVPDTTLRPICDVVDAKSRILEFQHGLIGVRRESLSKELQQVVDEDALMKMIPKDLESFFKVCFLLDHLDKFPQNANMWLIYLMTYIHDDLNLAEASEIVYCMDFLYSKLDLKANEISKVQASVSNLLARIKSCSRPDGSFQSSARYPPLEETRCALFSINLIEDLVQDMIFYYPVTGLKPVQKIFENVDDIEKTDLLIQSSLKK